MKRLIVRILNLWPKRWIVTALVLLLILYLTLVPRPLPDNDIDIPGLDKVVHAIMFGALAFAAGIDLGRRGRGQYAVIGRRLALCLIAAVAATGGVIEILQQSMNAGRSGDLLDFLADFIGVVVGALLARNALDIVTKQNNGSAR